MILITGATGLTGAHLAVELIRSGKAVRALRRPGSSLELISNAFRLYSPDPEQDLAKIEWIEGDIRDYISLEDALEGVDHVYHCAALVSFLPSDRKRLLEVNIGGTANLVNACLARGVKRICHVSSIAALGRSERDGEIITEKNSWKTSRNNTYYAIGKYGAEREVWRGFAEGLDMVVVNPSVILGLAGQQMGSSRLFSAVWNGLKLYPPGVNGFVDVRDVAAIMIRLMESGISGERFILNSENVAYRDLFNMIAGNLGKPVPSIQAKSWMAGLYWRQEALRSKLAGRKPLITAETARTAISRHYYSNEKIRKTLGAEFIPIRECLSHHCKIFREFIK